MEFATLALATPQRLYPAAGRFAWRPLRAVQRLAVLLALANCWGGDSVGPGPSDFTLEAGSPVLLTGHAGEAVAPVPRVLVKHDNGTAAADVPVQFTVSTGGGSVIQPETRTNSAGVASPAEWMLGSHSGSQQLTAASPNVPGRAIVFTAAVAAGPPAQLAFAVPPSLTAVDHAITPAIEVEVTDRFGNRIVGTGPNVTLALAAGGGGSVAGTLTSIAQNGLATYADVRLTLAGTGYRLIATAPDLPQATSPPFNVVKEGSPAIAAFEGNDQTAGVGTPVPVAPAVKVLDAAGSPVAGVSVTFTASNGGGVTGGVATTGADGIARVGSWTLGTSLGAQILTATANAATAYQGNPVRFSATAVAGPPDLARSSIDALQTSVVAGSETASIRVTVRDQYGNPVSGASVALSASGTGNTLDQPAPTGADGTALGSLRSTVAEAKLVTGTVGGATISDPASIVVAPGPVASISISPSPQVSVPAGSTLQLSAVTADAFGNVVPGAAVSWQTLSPAVATASPTGLVTGVAPISTSVTATSSGKSASVLVAVYGAATRLGQTYCTPGGTAVKLDAYFPSKTFARPRPAAIYIHGGAWQSGTSSDVPAELRQKLLDRGYVFLSLNYRLGPTYKWPAQGQDVRCAVRFLRANAFGYGIDASKILVTGQSAGGHLAAFLGTGPASGFVDINQHLAYDSRVQGVAAMAGVYDLTRPSELASVPQDDRVFVGWPTDSTSAYVLGASPVHLAGPTSAPFLLLHGELDTYVLAAQGSRMNAALTRAGASTSLILVGDADHSFNPVPPASTTTPTYSEILTMVADFFDSVVGGASTAVASPRIVTLGSS